MKKLQSGRRKKCLEKYGDEFYNNSKQISETKLNHSDERKIDIREKVKATMLERYGVDNAASLPRPLDYFMYDKDSEKYKNWCINVQNGYKRFLNDEARRKESFDNRKIRNQEKYGVDWPIMLFNNLSDKSYSKISQELFLGIIEKNALDDTCLFGENEIRLGQYRYDFAYKNKIIEFNGSYWHANPQKYKSSDIIKYPKGKTLTAKEIWDRDSIKQKYAIEQGYELLIIWEHDYKKDKQKILQECCEWISKS